MSYLNVEIKARLNNNPGDPGTETANLHAAKIRDYLHRQKAEFKGTDLQTDTYFNTVNGRLKLREGNIENNLIYYERSNQAGPKDSHFQLVKVPDPAGLKQALEKACGIKVVVQKKREIYYISNVKFHLDEVPGLGSFTEIEAGNIVADLSKEELTAQCEFYLKEFEILPENLVSVSYSDMLLAMQEKTQA